MTDSTGIAVIQDNKLLLGYRTDGQGWSLAGGKQEGSESLEECALRELYEEFGLKSDSLEYLGQVNLRLLLIINTNQCIHTYMCVEISKVKLN